MNETIVAKGLAKHLTEKFEYEGSYLIVKNKAQTRDHGYAMGDCASIIWEGGPYEWTYDTDSSLLDWVQEKYGSEYWLEAYSGWLLFVNKG